MSFSQPSPIHQVVGATKTISVRLSHDHLIVIATALIATIGFCCTEKIPFCSGFGWDGRVYGNLSKGELFDPHEAPISKYTIRRVLPSLMVYGGLSIVRVDLNNLNVIRAFGLLNILCLSSVAYCWTRIASRLQIGSRGKWLGACTLIVNFAVIKHTSWYPVLTDIPAYAIGCWMVYCYLCNRFWSLLALTAAGAFVWPTLTLQGLLLLLFPREEPLPVAEPTENKSPLRPLINLCFAGLSVHYFLFAIKFAIRSANLPISGTIAPSKNLLLLSMAIVGVYIFFVLWRLIDPIQCLRSAMTLLARHWSRALVIGLMLLAINGIYALARVEGSNSGPLYLLRLFIKSVYKPGIFVLGHTVYFGPIVPLAILLWSQVSREIRQAGLGMTLAIAAELLQSLDGESRHLIHAFPLIVPFVVLAVEKRNWSLQFYCVFVALSVAGSKFWLTMNVPGFEKGGNLLEYPLQIFAMNYGVFMNDESYLMQGSLVVAAGLLLSRFVTMGTPKLPPSDTNFHKPLLTNFPKPEFRL